MSPRKWTRQRVVDCIQDWHGRGVPTSLIWRQDRCLCAAGFAVFGSWRAALEAVGLTSDRPLRVTRSWTPEQILEAIQLHASRGLPLSALGKTDPALYASAQRIFGCWRNAIQAAGFDLPRPLTHKDVIQAIRSRHRQGLSLTHVWKTDRYLFNAAKKRFGNWQHALAAAGLPSKTIRRWSKKSIVAAIQRRQRHGPPLSHAWRDDKPLFQAGVNHFGNWRSALQAAGIPIRARQRWSPDRVLEGLRQTYKGQRNYRKD